MIYRKAGAKLLAFFGGRLVLMGFGGAALNPEVELFLRDSDFPFLIGYGLTEAAPLLAGGPYGDDTVVLGSTGKAIPRVHLRIADPHPDTRIGENLATGANQSYRSTDGAKTGHRVSFSSKRGRTPRAPILRLKNAMAQPHPLSGLVLRAMNPMKSLLGNPQGPSQPKLRKRTSRSVPDEPYRNRQPGRRRSPG